MLILDRKSKIYHHNYIDFLPVSLSWKKKSSSLSHTLRFPLDFTQKNPS